MPNVSSFGAQTDNSVVQGTVTDRAMVIPDIPPQGLMSVGPRVTPHFVNDQWNAQTTYNFFDVVKDAVEASYIAIKPVVPVGTVLTDENYWFKWSDPNAQISDLEKIVATYNDRISISFKTFDSVDAMQKSPLLHTGDMVSTEGRNSSNDGGAALYTVSETGTANGFTSFQLKNGLIAHLVPVDGRIAAETLGMFQSNEDNSTILESAQMYIEAGAAIVFKAGTYTFKNGVHLADGIKLIGADSARVGAFDNQTVLDFSAAATSCAIQITGIVKATGAYAEFPNSYTGTDIDRGVISISQCHSIENLTIRGSKNIETGVYLCGCINSNFENVTIQDFKNGLVMRTSWYNTYTNVCARNIDYIALYCANDSDQNVFSNCGFSNVNTDATQFTSPLSNAFIEPCVCYFNNAYGPHFEMLDTYTDNNNGSHILIDNARCISIDNVFAEGNAKYVISVKNAICITVGNVWEYNDGLKAFIHASAYDEMSVNSLIGNHAIVDAESDFASLSQIVITKPVRMKSCAIEGVYNNQYEISDVHKLYVDTVNGDDTNSGASAGEYALKTIDAAIKLANRYIKDFVTIDVKAGSYQLTESTKLNVTLTCDADTNITVNNYQIASNFTINNGKLTAPGAQNFFNVVNSASVKMTNTAIELEENQNIFNSFEQSVLKALLTNTTITGNGYLFNSAINMFVLYNSTSVISQTVKHNNVVLITTN